MKRPQGVILLVLLLGYLSTGIAIVQPGERAVVRRFGQVVAKPGPGLWIGLPWGIDRVDRVSVQKARQLVVGFDQSESTDIPVSPAGQLLTGDQNLLNARLVVDYSIDDAHVEQYLAHEPLINSFLQRETEAAALEWFSRYSVDAALANRTRLTQWLSVQVRERVASCELGIVIQQVSVEALTAPEEVRDAFEQVNQAQTTIRTKVNATRQEAERLLNDANSLAFRLSTEAEAARNERLTSAGAEAKAFEQRRAQYQRFKMTNPDILTTIWREEIGKLLSDIKSRTRIELLDEHLGPNGLELNTFIPSKRK